jgi:hypothetical protein
MMTGPVCYGPEFTQTASHQLKVNGVKDQLWPYTAAVAANNPLREDNTRGLWTPVRYWGSTGFDTVGEATTNTAQVAVNVTVYAQTNGQVITNNNPCASVFLLLLKTFWPVISVPASSAVEVHAAVTTDNTLVPATVANSGACAVAWTWRPTISIPYSAVLSPGQSITVWNRVSMMPWAGPATFASMDHRFKAWWFVADN